MVLLDKEKNELGFAFLNCYCSHHNRRYRHALTLWIRRIDTTVTTKKSQLRTNPPAFRIGEDQHHLLDPFHDWNQLHQLESNGHWPTRSTKKEFLDLLGRFDPSTLSFRSVRLSPEFAPDQLLRDLKRVKEAENHRKNTQIRLGKLKTRALFKINLALKLRKPVLNLTNLSTLSQRELAKELGVSRSFLRFCVTVADDDTRAMENKVSLETELEEKDDDNIKFMSFFKMQQLRLRTRKQLWAHFKGESPKGARKSLSSFDRHYLHPNRLTFQKCKILWDNKRLELRTLCRFNFIEQLLKSHFQGHLLLFFDESSFQLEPLETHAFGFSGQRPVIQTSRTPFFLKLLMVTSLHQVEAFMVTDKPVTSETIQQFLKQVLTEKAASREYSHRPVVLVMDNAPKNRSDGVKELARNCMVNLLFTVPCSPFLNQIESVFGRIKRTVRSQTDEPFWYFKLGIIGVVSHLRSSKQSTSSATSTS